MSYSHRTNQQNKIKKVRHNDWICSLCNNYNYSFRVSCNRCHMQLRNNNISTDGQHVRAFSKLVEHLEQSQTSYEAVNIKNFPNFLFLSLAEECSQQLDHLQQRECIQNYNYEIEIGKIIQ